MIIGSDPVFIDTNVLIYANLRQSAFYPYALKKLRELWKNGNGFWVSRQILREYLSAMTRQKEFSESIPISNLIEDINYFSKTFFVAEDTAQVTEKLLSLIGQIPTGGKQIHDANIVATMQVYGIGHLLTHNISDFERFSDVITIVPLIPN